MTACLTADQEHRLERIRSNRDRGYWRDQLVRLAGRRRENFEEKFIRGSGDPRSLTVIADGTSVKVRCRSSNALEKVVYWLGGNPYEPHADQAHWRDWGWASDDSWRRPGLFMSLTASEAVEFKMRFVEDEEVEFEVQ